MEEEEMEEQEEEMEEMEEEGEEEMEEEVMRTFPAWSPGIQGIRLLENSVWY